MTLWQACLLGIVQGVTEYLPVSSSAHLILAQSVLAVDLGQQDALAFNTLVQLGTAVSLLIYFALKWRRDPLTALLPQSRDAINRVSTEWTPASAGVTNKSTTRVCHPRAPQPHLCHPFAIAQGKPESVPNASEEPPCHPDERSTPSVIPAKACHPCPRAGAGIHNLSSQRGEILRYAQDDKRNAQDDSGFLPQLILLGLWVGLASVPAAILGLLCKNRIAALFVSHRAAAAMLAVTAAVLWLGEWRAGDRRGESRVALRAALWMGLAQTLALLPGISRSGVTIAAGLAAGLARPAAVRFSFLMAIPVVFGASLLVLPRFTADPAVLHRMVVPLAVGFGTAAVTGYAVIFWFMRFVQRHGLRPFAWYCLAVSMIGVFAGGG
ncbi:MAG: undecaprenyl-diphosphate phosphatase [Myxococcota bacterium]